MEQGTEHTEGDHSDLEVYRFFDPVTYLSTFLSHGVRPDGRALCTARTVTLNVGSISTANGSATVRLGFTRILAAVKMELSNPPLTSSSRGYIVCNVDLGASSSPEASSGPPSSKAQALSQNLQNIVSKFVDPEQLILLESKLCWAVYVDVVCLCNSGNVWDACVLATTAALLDTHVPVVDVTSGSPLVDMSGHQTSLKLATLPLTASFAVLSGDHYLLDPCLEEEQVCRGCVSLTFYEDYKLAQIKHTGEPLSGEKLIQLCKDGQEHIQTLYQLVNAVCKHNSC